MGVDFSPSPFSFTGWSPRLEELLQGMSTRSQSKSPSPEKLDVSESQDVYSLGPEFGINERKLMRKIDWHVVPWLALLYLLNFLDRGNIGNARVGSWYMHILASLH